MSGNSFYSKFKSLYEELSRLQEDAKQLSHEAKIAGEDVTTLRRLAQLVVRDKLIAEGSKMKKLADAAEQLEMKSLF